MLLEVNAAVNFLGKLLNSTGGVSRDSVDQFKSSLGQRLSDYYEGHWFPERPWRGSGYRCVRINHIIDPILDSAAKDCGIKNIMSYFPNELTMWVDPYDVSYRIGENGSVGQIYSGHEIPSKPDLTIPSQSQPLENVKTSGYTVLSSCKSQLQDLVSSKHRNYAFSQLATFVAS